MDLYKFCGPVIWTMFMIMVAEKTMFITDVQPLTISGKFTNYTWILERIWIMVNNRTQNTYINRIPGVQFNKTVSFDQKYFPILSPDRRHNDNDGDDTDHSDKELNTDDIHVFKIQNGELKEQKLLYGHSARDSVNYVKIHSDESQSHTNSVEKLIDYKNDDSMTDEDKIKKKEINRNVIHVGENSSEYNINKDDIFNKRRMLFSNDILESQQNRKREEILQFLEKHYQSTNYFYNEMKRILRERVLKDDLRLMIEELDKRDNKRIKELVLRYYRKLVDMRNNRLHRNIWKHKTNNLAIHVLDDPSNYGE